MALSHLLYTKYKLPPLRRSFVSREPLIATLESGLNVGHLLTLVSAPAGYGKTTLLRQWVADSGRATAWVSLDPGDDDPTRFLSYTIASLQTVAPSLAQDLLGALQSPRPPALDDLLAGLLNQIGTLDRELLLVYDDYHVITAQPIHDCISLILRSAPPKLHLALATRSDPPLATARLRANGMLTEIRQADLRFDSDHVRSFLRQVMDLDVTDRVADTVGQRNEGWIAGVQMAALALRPHLARGEEAVASFVEVLASGQRYIPDYFVEEVLAHQSQETQSFLLGTSILDRLNASLCDAVTQRDDSGQVLDALERANLFIQPLDDARQWFRYHGLFGDLLQRRLQQTMPEDVAGLHQRASAWCADHDMLGMAVGHALAASEVEGAADLVERAAEGLMLRSEFRTLLGWIEKLPADVARRHPHLCIYHAVGLLFGGESVSDAQTRLDDALMLGDDIARAEGAVIEALIATYQGDTSRAAELSQRALDGLPEKSLFFRSLIAGFLALDHVHSGNLIAAERDLAEAVRLGRRMGNVTIIVLALCHLAEMAMIGGDLNRARDIYDQALKEAGADQAHPLPIAGLACIGKGRLLIEQNQLAEAENLLTRGTRLIVGWGEAGAIQGHIGLSRLCEIQGDIAAAQRHIDDAHQLAIRFDAMQADDLYVDVNQVRLWIVRGHLEQAERWARTRGLAERGGVGVAPGIETNEPQEGDLTFMRASEQMVFAMLCVAQGRYRQALDVLLAVQVVAIRRGWVWITVRVRVIECLAHEALGKPNAALAALDAALLWAEPGGFVRCFVDEGAAIRGPLQRAAAAGIHLDYVISLLEALVQEAHPSSPDANERDRADHAQPLVEPLSDRELEVLRLLATGQSNKEIAHTLFIAVGTAKKHLKNIYGKLQVHNRTEAVARARHLDIL